MTSFYDFEATDITGREVSMETFKDRVVLVVNTASRCGFTPQFEGLEALYREYKDRGFTVLGFPCNQFGNQDLGDNAEISAYCQVNYGVSFPMFAKIDVNGDDAHPLYRWLKEQQKGLLGDRIKWNFTKFLINRDGEVVDRYAPQTTPASLKDDIEALLD